MSSSDDSAKQEDNKNRCESYLETNLSKNIRILQLIKSIESAGCTIPKDFFACRQCDGNVTGGFRTPKPDETDYKPQVVLCQNNMLSTATFEHTIAHELVHAYDQCRAKVEWSDCLQHACSEVRASSLSGECSYMQEMLRGKSKFAGGHRPCVERRATLSVEGNPKCAGLANAAVKKVFKQCYADISPFDEHPN